LIIIDEVSMLTLWVANQVSVNLQSISVHDGIEFSGKLIPHVNPCSSLAALGMSLDSLGMAQGLHLLEGNV
jgi:hypothetical protein